MLAVYIRFKAIVNNTNIPANHFVARVSRASSVFDLFFERKVSELPLSAPDRPEDFPDCNETIAIIAMHMMRWIITKGVFIKSNPFRLL